MKNCEEEKFPEYQNEIFRIKRIIKEEVILTPCGVREGTVQFRATVISEEIPKDHLFLVSFDTTNPRLTMEEQKAAIHKEELDYYGMLVITYCKKKKNIFGREVLKTEQFLRKIYNQKEWQQDPDRVSLLELAGITSVDVQREQQKETS